MNSQSLGILVDMFFDQMKPDYVLAYVIDTV